MDDQRDEVYERIPWETLEKRGADRRWMVYAVAGAIALGAITYSFIRNQPPTPPPAAAEPAVTTAPPVVSTTTVPASPSTLANPVVVSEADLYAVDPERVIDQAASHAEWLAAEYISYDGSEQSEATLASLLPSGAPLPQGTDGAQVFVDWTGTSAVVETGALSFDVSVLVRSLSSTGESGFVRQPARLVIVPVEVTDEGARAIGVPVISPADPLPTAEISLVSVPEEVVGTLDVEGEVVGGRQLIDGSWELVVMAPGEDGVARPVSYRP